MSTNAESPRPGLATSLGLSPPAALQSLTARKPVAGDALDIGIVLIAYVIFNVVVTRASWLPPDAYFQPILTVALFERLGVWLSIASLAAVALLTRFGGLGRRWETFDDGPALRLYSVILMVVIAWPLTTYGYNYYFDQLHLADRLVLLALIPLAWFRPAFVLPFVALGYVILWQFGQPLSGGTVFAHKLQVLHQLELMCAFVLVRSVIGGSRSLSFVFLACCLVASSYWMPALAKLQIGWLQHMSLHLMPASAWAHGWLSWAGEDTLQWLVGVFEVVEWPMALFTLAFETAFLLFLLHRRVSVLLLVAAIVFHAGVFIAYGFLFWTWAALDAALILLLLRLNPRSASRLYARPLLALSVLVIAAGAWWARPPHLGWHETRLGYTYQVRVHDGRGSSATLGGAFFGPYSDVFTQVPFAFLVDAGEPLVSSYGVTKDGPLAARINSAESTDVLLAMEPVPNPRYDPARADAFYSFVARYVGNYASGGDRLPWLGIVDAPAQFWGYASDSELAGIEIREISVIQNTWFYDGVRMEPVRRVELARFEPDPAPD